MVTCVLVFLHSAAGVCCLDAGEVGLAEANFYWGWRVWRVRR